MTPAPVLVVHPSQPTKGWVQCPRCNTAVVGTVDDGPQLNQRLRCEVARAWRDHRCHGLQVVR